ncbi:LOW QUALITY PROTEIN: hypothetical protein Cgig2_001265 [Carnegiea gigantea]|uniref:Aminotransferase-like plant mobile domain-containing protein n=1 Tax=Carnegiea gigantea TaxID=171969 RepID=A0A9Q1GR63_9CARY|nr:LOW QUALITY PROTEIN: hypothetical protein Cgig2_001265 [Carnegiea gigantea]
MGVAGMLHKDCGGGVPGEQCRKKLWWRGSSRTQGIYNREAQGKVYSMELRKRQRGVSSSDSDDDISEYKAKDEGKDNAESSSLVMGEDEVSGSSEGCAMPELRSKKRHNKGCVRDVGVSGKPPGNDVQHVEASEEAVVDVVIRHWCTLEAVCSLNAELEEVQKSAMEGTVWRPILKYRRFGIDRHLVRALVEGWNAEAKAFKGDTIQLYDVALLTGLPTNEKQVTFDRGIGASEVEEVIKVAMEDHLANERNRRRSALSDVRLYRNYMVVMVELCKQNNTAKSLELFRKLYTLLVISGILFPRTAGGMVWELIGMTEDVEVMGEYNWLAAIWSFLVEVIEETKQKLRLKKNLHMAGFAMTLQSDVSRVTCGLMCVQLVWFYEHTNLYAYVDEKCIPRIASWVNLYIGHSYDATVLISSMEDNQWLRQAREALHLEKEAYATTKKKLEYMTKLLMARGEAAEVEKGLLLSPTQEGSRDGPGTGGTPDECGDRSDIGCIVGEGPMGEHVGVMFTTDRKVWRDHAAPCNREEREIPPPLIRRRLHRHNPFAMQTSPYVNLEATVGAGKRKGGIIRCYQKQAKKFAHMQARNQKHNKSCPAIWTGRPLPQWYVVFSSMAYQQLLVVGNADMSLY